MQLSKPIFQPQPATLSSINPVYINIKYCTDLTIPHGLMVRIPGFHPGGPGSIPGVGSYRLDIPFVEIKFSLKLRVLNRGLLRF